MKNLMAFLKTVS